MLVSNWYPSDQHAILVTSEVDALQVIVNCFVPWKNGFVMLRKPRRGWWYLPGGKVEDDELWRHAAMREFTEESGLQLEDAVLRGIYRVRVEAGSDTVEKNRLIAQFVGRGASGTLRESHREGTLAVATFEDFFHLPMDEGDRLMVLHTLKAEELGDPMVFFGKFSYDHAHQLKNWEIDPPNYPISEVVATSERKGDA